MEEIDELKKLLKELSKKDLILLQESWQECINMGYLEKFPKICQDSYVKELKFDDYKNYIFDDNESIEDRYAKYFRICMEYRNLDFELTNDNQKLIYKKLLLETINSYDFIKCNQDNQIKINDRIYIFITQYLPNSLHAPSVLVEKIFQGLKKYCKEIFIISTTPYPYPYPHKSLKSFNYSGVEENTFYKLAENIFYVEFRGYISESLYFEFIKHQAFTNNDKFFLVGHSSIHFDLIESDKKFVLPTSLSTLNINSSNFLVSASNIESTNIFGNNYKRIKSTTDFTRNNNLPFKIKQMSLDNITIAIVGNRLNYELDSKLFEALENLLLSLPNIKLKIIGNFSNKQLISINLLKHIEFIPYISDLDKYFHDEIDFFLNPKREGGGQSSVMAFKIGVPIITLPYGDVYEFIERRYCINSYDEIESFIIKYISNFEFKDKIDSVNRDLTLRSDNKFDLMINELLEIGL